MENEEKVPAWADALGKKLDSVCSRMDAIENKGGDKFEAKADSFESLEKKVEGEGESKEEAEKVAGKVAEEKKEKADRKDSDDKEKEKDEKKDARKDSEEEKKDAAERDDARKDSQRENSDLRARITAMDARLASMSQPLSSEDRDHLSQAQRRADSLAQLFGDSADQPLHGESPIAYRKRLAAKFQKHSPSLKSVKLDSQTPEAFVLMEERIYADAQSVAMNPANAPKGRLIPSIRTDAAGRQITTYTGDMDSWLGFFKSPGTTTTINRNLHNDSKGNQ